MKTCLQDGHTCVTLAIQNCRYDDGCECNHIITGKMTTKFFQALNGSRIHDFCVAGAMLSKLNYQSYIRAVVNGLALYVEWTEYSAQVYKFHGNRCSAEAIKWRHDDSHNTNGKWPEMIFIMSRF